MLNLFVAVERPGGIERVILDCAAILLIAWIATVLSAVAPGGAARLPIETSITLFCATCV